MGNEYSIQSSGANGVQEVFVTKLERIVEVLPAETSSPDATQGTSKASWGEEEVERHNTKLERVPEMQQVGEALANVALGTSKSGFGEDSIGQSDKQQNGADTLSLPNEVKETQVLQENCPKGDTSLPVPEGVVDVMKEARPGSEVNAVRCCSGETTEVVTVDHLLDSTSLEENQHSGQVCESHVGGQSLEHNLSHQDLSRAYQKPAASRESHTVNRKLVCFLLNEVDFTTTNLFKASPDVNNSEAQHLWERAAVTVPQSTEKCPPDDPKQLQCCGVEKPSSILAKAVPNEPALERADTQLADLNGEEIPQKITQTMHTELETTPVVTQQAKAEMEDTTQDWALNGGVPDLLKSAEKPVNTPEEEGKLQMSRIPEKKKVSCCTVL